MREGKTKEEMEEEEKKTLFMQKLNSKIYA